MKKTKGGVGRESLARLITWYNLGVQGIEPYTPNLHSGFSANRVVIIFEVVGLFGVLRTKVTGSLLVFSNILKILTFG